MPGHVFISYRHGDEKRYIMRLADHLVGQGIPVWLDRELIIGDRWDRVIRLKIDGCAAFVVVMTPEAEESDWVAREIDQAESTGRPILPVLLAGKRFFRLANLQYEDVTGDRLPSPAFVARLRGLCAGEPGTPPVEATPRPRVARPRQAARHSAKDRPVTTVAATIPPPRKVGDRAQVADRAQVGGTAHVADRAQVGGTAQVAPSSRPAAALGIRSYLRRHTRVATVTVVAFVVSAIVSALLTRGDKDPDGPSSLGHSSAATISPSTAASGAGASDVALSFGKAWVKHTKVTPQSWLNSMKPYITDQLASEMNGVDPAGVPASRLTGSPKVVSQNASVVQVEISADAGRISLRVTRANGQWLVDGIDWDAV